MAQTTLSTVFNAVDKVSNPIKRMTANAKRGTSSMSSGFDKVGQSIDRMRNLLIGGAIYMAFKKIVGAGMEMENVKTDFEVLTGSMEEADAIVDQLRKKGASTPFEFQDLAQSTKQLMQFGLSAKDSMGMLDMMGDISMGNKERLQGLSLVMGQVASNGKLMGQDLMQMINQGFNPLVVMAKRGAKSEDEFRANMARLRQEMSQGKISFDDVKQAMQEATGEGGQFFQGMQKGSQTLSGLWSTLLDSVTNLFVVLDAKLFPAFKRITVQMTAIITSVGDWAEKNQELIGTGLDVVMAAIETTLNGIVAAWNSGLLPALLAGIAAYKAITMAMAAYQAIMTVVSAVQLAVASAGGVMNAVLAMSPIFWIVGAVMLLVLAGIALYKNWDKIGPFFADLWVTLKKWFLIGLDWVIDILSWFSPPLLIYRHWDTIGPYFWKMWAKVKEYFWIGVDWLKEALFFLSPPLLIYRHWDKITAFFSSLWSSVNDATGGWLGRIAQVLFDWSPVGLIYNQWGGIVGFFANLWATVKGVVADAVAYISSILEAILGKVMGVINKVRDVGQKVKGFFTGDDSGASSPNNALIQSSESRSTVDVNFNNAPKGTTIRQNRPAPGVNLKTGPAT